MTNCSKCSLPLNNGLCEVCLFRMATELPSQRMVAGDAHHPSIEELNSSFPQFKIQRLIGRGGMGMIYHARQTNLDRDVAIKIIDRRFPRDSEFFDRFEREAKALAKLTHPNVVTIFDFGHTSSGQAYLVMEYVHGLNLREAMEALSIEKTEAISIVKQVCNALQYAHAKGVVHRDIKPENILLGEDGTVKIADFGIARVIETDEKSRLTATQQVLGTFHYLAPEQMDSPEEVNHRVDIYALGVILYELLTRKLPIGNFELPSHLVANLDRRLDDIVLKTLHRRPTARFQSAEELRNAIEQLEVASSVEPSSLPVIEPLPTVSSHHPSTVSIPFESRDLAGFAQVLGSIQVLKDRLRLEYRIRDAFFGTLKTKVRTIDILWEQIARVDFRGGAFNGVFTIVVNSISALQNFPGSETGRIEAKIKRVDHELAEKTIDRIRAVAPSLLSIEKRGIGSRQPFNVMVAITLIFFAILNAGTLAILQIIFASELDGMALAICAVAAGVMFGPILVTQLVSGLVYASTGYREAARIGAIVSMFPVTPVAFLGIPFGIKTQKWLDNGTGFVPNVLSQSPPQTKSKGWGATTLVFMRDARNARLVALLETIGTAAVFGGIALFFFGLYPSTMQYRVVGPSAKETLEPLIQKRLRGIGKVKLAEWDDSQFTIDCWQYQQSAIADRLALPSTPSIRFLVTNQGSNRSERDIFLPSKVERLSDAVISQSTSTGVELLSRQERLELKEEHVSRIRIERGSQIIVELSKAGWDSMQTMLKGYETRVEFGLEIEGWIEGLSRPKAIQDQIITFELSENAKHTALSIQSSVRGPVLPNELEWLK
jgi:serine/threonine protein kinase